MDVRDRESILVDLRREDDEMRRLAVERASVLPVEEAVAIFLERLGDPSWRVRKAAIERLVSTRDLSASVGPLIRALGDGENPGRRNAALEALTRCRSAALPALLEASHDEDVDVRKQVVDALGGIADPASTTRLCELLRDPDPNVRGAAADALGQSRDASAGPALLRAANEDPNRLARLSALRGLAQLEVPVAPVELAGLLGDPSLRPAVYSLLGASDDPEAEEWLLKGLSDTSRSSREAAMEAIVRMAAGGETHGFQHLASRVQETVGGVERLVPDVVERLQEAPPPRRLALVQFLGLLGRPDTVEPLLCAGADEALRESVLSSLECFGRQIETLVDGSFPRLPSSAQLAAVELLGRTRGEVGARRLEQVLAGRDPELKAAAALSLGQRGAVEALPRLVEELRTASDVVETDPVLLEALGQAIVEAAGPAPAQGAPAPIDLLVEQLPGAGESFRVMVAGAMGGIGRPEDAERIGALLADPSERVRRAAAESLGRIARGEPPEPLRLALADESSAVRIGAASALALVGGPQAVEDLVRLGADHDGRVRSAALRALGTCLEGGDGVLPQDVRAVLESALGGGGAAALSGLDALMRIGGEEAVELARGLLESPDPELARLAVACLARHASVDAVDQLGGLLSHEDWSVRVQVAEALETRGSERCVPLLLRCFETEGDDLVRRAILRALDRLER